MPTNLSTPTTNASIDRLTLGVDSPRGVEPSHPNTCWVLCFEAETSAQTPNGYGCYCAEEA